MYTHLIVYAFKSIVYSLKRLTNKDRIMSNEKKRHLLLNINRFVIYLFGLLGLFFDYTFAYMISMTLWLWLPSFIQYEQKILRFSVKKRG